MSWKDSNEDKLDNIEEPEIQTKGSSEEAKLTAKVDSILEVRKTDSERFSRLSEGLGELRNLIIMKSLWELKL
jgi:hypothetical protein